MNMEEIKQFLLSPKLWLSAVILVASVALWIILRKCVRSFITKSDIHGKKETNIRFGAIIVKYIIAVFAIITVLQINGINVTSLITGLGIAGIIIGFALQDILKDLIMGTNIVWDEFFSVGDVVRYGNIEGKIIHFNIKVTKIADVNTGNIFTVSNRNVSEIEIISDWLDIKIPAPYEENAGRMREICEEIRAELAGIPEVTSCEFLGTDEFADSLVNYRVRLHCPPELKNPIRRKSLGIIQDVYEKNGISVPYPQADIHIKQADE